MKKVPFVSLLLIFVFFLATARAEESPAPSVYKLKIVYIFEIPKTEAILVVGNSGFRTVEALENWLTGLPAGTTLELDMSCESLGVEPLVRSEKEMNDFKRFCDEHKINLIIHPAG